MWQYALLPDGTDTKREYNVWKTEAQSHFIKLDEDSQEEFLCLQDDIAANLYKEFTEKGITCKPEDFFVLRTADMIFEDWDN